jgi:FtsZ-interacting cell division protein ZipA
MPQLRWTLLALGVLFVILLAWIEHRRQRRQGFTDHHPPADKDAGEVSPPPMMREPVLSLPEMRAARDPGPAQELPVVEIEEDSLDPRRVEPGEARAEPPTLSLPVLESGPITPRARSSEPAVSSFDSVLKPENLDARAKALGDTRSLGEGKTHREANLSGDISPVADRRIPRLDTPAPESAADSEREERAFNEDVFGNAEPAAEAVNPRPARANAAPAAFAQDTLEEDEENDTEAAAEAAPVDSGGDGISDEAGFSDREGSDPGASDQPRFTAADVTPIVEPIVEWPPDDQRRVVALRLVAAPPERLAGRALRLALASEGFVLGKFQIFHKPDASGRAVLSAANLSKPGIFDLGTMDSQRFSGLSLFTVLPGPKPPLKAFDDLLNTARNLNERLQGALQDERGGPLTPTRVASLRESLAAETMS